MALGDSNANGMIMPVAPTGGFGNNGMGGDCSRELCRMHPMKWCVKN